MIRNQLKLLGVPQNTISSTMNSAFSIVIYILVFTAKCGLSSPLKDSEQLFENLKNKGWCNPLHNKSNKINYNII